MTDEYDAVVYDLDGTLVDLAVDWGEVRTDVADTLRDRGVDVDGRSLWDMLERSIETGDRDAAEAAIAEHERRGARDGTRLALAEDLPRDVPVGVCSLNCEDACRVALEIHDVLDHVDVVVGRDSCETYKPDPESLLEAVEALDADPGATLFVGDSKRDKQTAERAGTDFRWASDYA